MRFICKICWMSDSSLHIVLTQPRPKIVHGLLRAKYYFEDGTMPLYCILLFLLIYHFSLSEIRPKHSEVYKGVPALEYRTHIWIFDEIVNVAEIK